MADQAKAVAESKDQVRKYKITVDGKEEEVEMTDAQIVEHLQKSKDYTNKTKALADERKSLEERLKKVEKFEAFANEVAQNPALDKALSKTYADVKAGKISKSEGKDRNLKLLDKKIDETTDITDREALKEMRTIIAEETNVEEVLKRMESIEAKLTLLDKTSRIGLGSVVENEIQKVEDEFGKEFTDKYRKDLRTRCENNPGVSAKVILKLIVPDNEYDEAILSRAEKRKKDELERKKKGSSVGGEEIVAPKSKYEYDKQGRVTMDSLIKRAKERLGKA